MLFSKYSKKYTYKCYETQQYVFVYSLFQILKKSMLTNLKNPWHNFLACSLLQTLKKYTYKTYKNIPQFFCLSILSSIKKSLLTNLKRILHNFIACPLFQILKETRLTNSKKPCTIFFLVLFSKY